MAIDDACDVEFMEQLAKKTMVLPNLLRIEPFIGLAQPIPVKKLHPKPRRRLGGGEKRLRGSVAYCENAAGAIRLTISTISPLTFLNPRTNECHKHKPSTESRYSLFGVFFKGLHMTRITAEHQCLRRRPTAISFWAFSPTRTPSSRVMPSLRACRRGFTTIRGG
jgi:hypothetical protein